MSLNRRTFVQRLLSWGMIGGLVASYGSLTAMALRFLYPTRASKKSWVYAAQVDKVAQGAAFSYKAPDGNTIEIARLGNTGKASDFVALSNVCPHLGCIVHWEGHNNRFFCPCHNGVFNPAGIAIAGPPAKAGQSLKRFPLKIENGLLFVHVGVETRLG